MCHLVLLMPLFGLAVFWVLPIPVAVPVYLLILSLSGLVYYALMNAMHQPVKTGWEGLTGDIGEIMDIRGPKGHVAIHGEIWEADINGRLHRGDKVVVTKLNGLRLMVRKL